MNEQEQYPDLGKLCRLCLKLECSENGFQIFNTDDSELSIPMRIMTCASLEVKAADGLPKQICSACRYELEKSFLFRKRCQVSDTKLRKHTRLISLGKKSRVFFNSDDEEDELEFEDSVMFLKEQDEIKNKRNEHWKDKYKREMEELLVKQLEDSKTGIKEELREEVMETVRNELRATLREEVRGELVVDVREQLRSELKEETRKEQISILLSEMEVFLTTKQAYDGTVSENDASEYNIIEKAAQSADIHISAPVETTRSRKRCISPNPHCSEEKKFKSKPAVKRNKAETNNYNTDPDSELNKSKNNMNNKVYIIEDNTHFSKSPNAAEPQVLAPIGQENNEIDYSFQHKNNNEITSYEINENGEIQKLSIKNSLAKKKPKLEAETDSNVMLLELDDDLVELVDLNEEKNNTDSEANSLKPSAENKNYNKIVQAIESIENRHIVTTTPQRHTDTVKSFCCSLCPIEFSTETALRRHARSHQRVLEKGIHYECSVCKMYLSCASSLKRHMVIHTGEKPYACNICDKTFIQREILKRHMDTHSGVRPYVCEHCHQRFAQKTNLQTHVNKLHLDAPKLHACHLCPKQFTHASGLSRHLTTHSGIMYQCTICQRRFGDRSSVKRHVANVHADMNLKLEDGYAIMPPGK